MIDQLVAEGVALDRHYAYRICGPARSALLSGRQARNKCVALCVCVCWDLNMGLARWFARPLGRVLFGALLAVLCLAPF